MANAKIRTPAKINIGLYITSKRQDGYHNIETIFYPISLSDIITIEDSDSFYFSSSDKSITWEDSNLIVKAKNLLEEYSGEKLNYRIHLEKNIPIGAGLGGGSSDAAAVLKKLNILAGLNLSGQELFDLALRLGSDIPFFLNPGPVFAEGRGEIIHPLIVNIELPIVIVNPGIHISTAWAYNNVHPGAINRFNLRRVESLDSYHLKILAEELDNDFEKVVFEKYPSIKDLKLLHNKMGAVFTLMSGSGSTVFGIYPDKKSAEKSAKIMKDEGYFVYIHNELRY